MKVLVFCQRRFMSTDRQRKLRFFDSLRVYARGGAGGQGLPSRGGIGGKGGNVVFLASQKTQLKNVIESSKDTKRFIAGCGQNSMKKVLVGQPGDDRVVKVPVGVTLITDDGQIIADLNEEGQSAVAAEGGDGGNIHNHFLGQKGQARSVRLDLKLIADIGLVGFPNAGKSTFLKAISRAEPKIAEYPFTTLRPQLGTMQYKDQRKITVADLPGLIEGAHINFGMGHKFLKHIERTKLLLFVVDISGFQLNKDSHIRNAFETVLLLNKEIELYDSELLKKPVALALNKMDLDEDGSKTEEVLKSLRDMPNSMNKLDRDLRPSMPIKFDHIFKMSTAFDETMGPVKTKLRLILDEHAEKEMEHNREHVEHMKNLQHMKGLLGREHSSLNLL